MARHSGYVSCSPFPSSPGDTVRCPGASGGYEPAPGTADVAAGLCGGGPALGHHPVRAGTPLLPIMGSTMVITSQHLLYGFTFRRDVLPLSLRWRASLAFFLTDEMFAVALKERERSGASIPPMRSSRALSSICSGTWRPCSASPPASTSRAGQDGTGFCHRRHLYRHDAPRHEEPCPWWRPPQ